MSSATVAESPAFAGTSCIAFTVIVTESVALLSSPSLAINVRAALVLSSAALVHVIVAIAVLTSTIVPPKVIALSAIPSPESAAKVRPDIEARVNVPL